MTSWPIKSSGCSWCVRVPSGFGVLFGWSWTIAAEHYRFMLYCLLRGDPYKYVTRYIFLFLLVGWTEICPPPSKKRLSTVRAIGVLKNQ